MDESKLIYIVALMGDLLGGFPTGVVLSRGKYGLDVREMGSGNIGATNITRVFGWYAGVLTFVIDFLKGWLPLLAIRYFFPREPWLLTVAGAFLVLGHCYSPYLKLHGGKGVATSFGCLLAVAPWSAVAAGAVYALLLATVKISAVGSLGGIAAAMLYALLFGPDKYARCLVYAISFVVVIRHRSNIFRLIGGVKSRKGKS